MNHKSNCTCHICSEANEVLKAGRVKRFIPKHVLAEIQEKRAKENELMLWKGFIVIPCPACKHHSYMKIGPVMTCPCCCHKIS